LSILIELESRLRFGEEPVPRTEGRPVIKSCLPVV
jgi:hypothetical protein